MKTFVEYFSSLSHLHAQKAIFLNKTFKVNILISIIIQWLLALPDTQRSTGGESTQILYKSLINPYCTKQQTL